MILDNELRKTATGRPTELDLDDFAVALARRFIRRWDLYSKQRGDGRYVCVHERLHHEHLLEHLQGISTLGSYLLDADSTGIYLVFDADSTPDWRRLRALAEVLDEFEITAYLERSRRGGHLWLFFADPLPGYKIRRFGQGLMLHFGLGSLELFPKQARLRGGPGSLIRLPFGVHRKSGKRYSFYLPDGRPLAPTLREQIKVIEGAETVPSEIIEQFSARAPARKRRVAKALQDKRSGQGNGPQTPLFELVKQAITVQDFVSQFVELSSNGSGLCPFHDDHVDSFSVHGEQNYWKCFACEKSGSIIDFWMYFRDCDFNTAVSQLAEMLL